MQELPSGVVEAVRADPDSWPDGGICAPQQQLGIRGYSPGRHIDPGHLGTRLRGVFGARAARLGTLHELTRLAPVAILAEALGYSPATIERHAVDPAAAYGRYVAAVRDT
jgi:hypothetical protein